MKTLWCAGIAVFFGINSSIAHDFWIKPSSFHSNLNSQTGLHLLVGQNFEGETVPRMSNWFDRFIYINGNLDEAPQPIIGKEWNDPAGNINITQPGLHVIGFQSRHQSVVIDPATFAFYLEEEGLGGIAKLREARGDNGKKGNEIFLRCCKALIPAGESIDKGFDYTFGFKLELIPQKHPLNYSVDEELPFQLLFFGKPVEGVLVAALEKQNPLERITARTDTNGMVSLKLPKKGHWLIKAVHMTEVEDEDAFADWQSFWASFVFNNAEK